MAWFNLTGVYESVEEGSYDDNEAIRSATIAQKFCTMTLVVYDKYNATTLHFALKGKTASNESLTVCAIFWKFEIEFCLDAFVIQQTNFFLSCLRVLFQFNFTVFVDAKMEKVNETGLAVQHDLSIVNETLKTATNATKETFKFDEVPLGLQ